MGTTEEPNGTMDMTALGPQEFACGPIYALELAMNNHARYIKTRADVVIVWFHWCLLRNGFYFFGGELTHNDFHSETLPPNLGFNGDRRAYVLKYGKGVMPYVVGFYLKGEGIDISFVSLYRSLRLNIGIEDLVDDCLNLQDDVVQQLTMLVDEELIKPMQLETGDDDDEDGGGTDDAAAEEERGSTTSGIQTDPSMLPQSAQTLLAQQRLQSQLSKSSTSAVQTDPNMRASGPQTLMAMSSPSPTAVGPPLPSRQANKPTLLSKRTTPFTRRPDERYRIQRVSTPNTSKQNTGDLSDMEDVEEPPRGLRKRRGPTGCCG